jgi:hypothetical protein
VRLVSDTLYGWEFQKNRAPKDSVAIALHRVRAIEQTRLDVPGTVGLVIVGTATAVALFYGILILVLIHQGD